MNPKVNAFFIDLKKWGPELEVLRSIILTFPFEEDLKWNTPCYMLEGKNVVIIHGFKEYFALMFFKGALLKDSQKLLFQPGETQAGRQLRFKSMDELLEKEDLVRAYVQEAIDLEKTGAKVEMRKPDDFEFPKELLEVFEQNISLRTAFFALTPGRQKAYCKFISEAKQSQTRFDRIEKYQDRILMGKGVTDCTCGLSKRMPNCDGSHKFAKQA